MRQIEHILRSGALTTGACLWLSPALAQSQDTSWVPASLFSVLMLVACGALVLAMRHRRRFAVAEEKARYFAHHEPLTGLLNRPHFIAALDAALLARVPQDQIAVLCIDLDGLGDINDLLGHENGDAALVRTAQRLRDVAPEGALLARLSGDKFAVAGNVLGLGDAKDFAGAVLKAVSEPFILSGHEVALAAQIGIAIGPGDGEAALRLMKGAGLALDRARLRQGNYFVFFERTIETELQRRRELEQQIRDTLAAQAFDLHFQPLFGASKEQLVGFEALLRMPDQNGGFVSPAVFIPVAEEIGLIVEIGDWVLRRACAVAALWPEHLTIAVNLSPAQFKAGGVHRTVTEALAGSGLAPHRLELEITEGLVLNDDAAVMRELAELKALGVSIVMDDFGTGYSSLSYLWKFPFDKIKIDRSFMRALGSEDATVGDVLQAIMSLSRALRMRVTAEGVETRSQADFLKVIGCDEVQGFYFARPMPVDEVALAILRSIEADATDDAPSENDHEGMRLAG
jgi:diguanylate cyclase (GGDEF)-like protein